MRFLALIAVVAIIYVAVSRHATTQPSSDVKDARAMIDSTLKQTGQSAPAPAASSGGGGPAQSNYRADMDRARAVVGLVHQQQSGN